MKTCPECGTQLSDKQEICPACGANYLEATIASITGNAGTTESDTAMMLLNGMEDSLRILNSVSARLYNLYAAVCRLRQNIRSAEFFGRKQRRV